ncbi:MAG: IclR family transcriptional regulator [Pyramidobacter sp.]|uniref:IclR family transcriptional regulator n=1 Tax=Pyramidobacter sp. TaxID=1943581 RepID=UPI002A80B2E9|nr:IclR family transcriptional regulator [Pyramidobacter sp.]MDY4031742.1 IclR family transcriptional regulator [Pyramidobacter sp.]
MSAKSVNGVSSIRKCLSVLDCFSEDAPQLSLTAVTKKTGFSMPTTLRVLAALCEEGFLERDANRLYRVSWKAYRLGKLFQAHDSIKNAVLPVMRRLRDVFGETVSLYYKHDIWRVCVEQAVSLHELKRISHPGSYYPLWAGATAKIFLGFMTSDEIRRVYAEAPQDRKERWAQFLGEVAEARQRGYAVSLAEREEGTSSIACPLFDFTGKLAACLCISGPSFRFTDEIKAKAAPVIVRECRELSRSFGAPDSAFETRSKLRR